MWLRVQIFEADVSHFEGQCGHFTVGSQLCSFKDLKGYEENPHRSSKMLLQKFKI